MAWNEPGGDNKDPWSGRDQDKGPPDLDQVIRSMQDKLGGIFGGGSDGQSGQPGQSFAGMGVVLVIALLLWCATGLYKIDAGLRGVITRFGAYTETTQPGLHWHLPVPIETVTKVNVKKERFLEVGYRSGGRQQSSLGSVPREALMLTEDENIVDARLAIQYQVKDAKNFLFNVFEPSATLKQVTESAERGVIGQSKIDFVLLEGRSEIVARIKKEIQDIMDTYEAGILVTSVNLQDAQPPEEVQAAFEDAIKAREDKQRFIREAQAYMKEVIPQARGAAARRVQAAQAYKAKVISEAKGDASRFDQLLVEYSKAPEITRKRLYLEAIEKVLQDSETVVVDVESSNNLLYLPLDKLGSSKKPGKVSSTRKPSEYVTSSTKPKSSVTNTRTSTRGRDRRGR